MSDGTRLIFWLDLIILLVVVLLAVMGKWDWVIAVAVGLVVLNYFDQWLNRRQRRS